MKVVIRSSRRSYVLICYEDSVLVVKGFISNNKWHLPGGGCHAAESYRDAVIRETKEEVGVDLSDASVHNLSEHEFRSEEFGFQYRLFSVIADSNYQITKQKFELVDAQWVSVSELHSGNSGKEVLQAIALAQSR